MLAVLPRISARAAAWVETAGLWCLFAVPLTMLLVNPSSDNPFIADKTAAFRLAAVAAFACAGAASKIRPTSLIFAYGAFVAALFVANIYGVDPSASFFGNRTRVEGFATPVSYLIYLLAVISLINTTDRFRAFMAAWAISGIAAAIAGTAELAYFATFAAGAIVRVRGVMADANPLGAYLFFSMAFTAICAASARSTSGRLLWLAAMGFEAAVLIFTASRAAVLGVMAAAIIIGAMSPQLVRRHVRAIFVGTGALIIVLALNWALSLDPLVGRFGEFESSHRLDFWRLEIPFILQHPILGWGQDGLKVAYQGRMMIDRSYNLILDLMSAGGIVALACYAAVLIAAGTLAFRRMAGLDRSIALAALAGYVTMTMFTFDTITSAVGLMTILAWIQFSARVPKSSIEFTRERLAGMVA